MNSNLKKQYKNNKGQTFIEFLLLLIIVLGLSFAMIQGTQKGLKDRWRAIVSIIVNDSTDKKIPVEFAK